MTATTPTDTAPPDVTALDLAHELDAAEDASCHPWVTGFVVVKGHSLAIDQEASDVLCATVLDLTPEQGRAHNENHSDFMVAGGLAVRHIDGLGWSPVATSNRTLDLEELRQRLPAIRRGEESLRPGELEALIAAADTARTPAQVARTRTFVLGLYVELEHPGFDGLDAQERALDALALHEGRETVSVLSQRRGGRTIGRIRRVSVLSRHPVE